MAVSAQQASHWTVETPENKRLHRLAVEAGKYLGLSVGEPLPTEEIVAQGEANGYDEREVRDLLRQEGYNSAESLPVPPQGDAFGELWRAHRTPQALFSPEVQSFREWQAEREENRCTEYDDGAYQHTVEHAYSLYKARERDVRARDVGRHFIEEYDSFTTVIITYCAEKGPSEPIHQHASKFYPAALSRTRWNVFNRGIDTDEWAGCRMLAPEKPATSTPSPTFTHGHSVLWVAGHHSVEDFTALRDTFLKQVEGATAEMNPLEDMIQVRHHTSAEIEPSDSVKRQDLDEERGPTTAASGEVGNNLPILRARNALRERDASAEEWATADARDCPDWVEVWAAHLRCQGEPDKLQTGDDSGGVSRWGTLGSFTEIADSVKERRESESVKAGGGVRESDEDEDNTSTDTLPDELADTLSETEQRFVNKYVAANLPTDRNTIEANVRRNLDEFGPAGVNIEQVIQVVQEVVES